MKFIIGIFCYFYHPNLWFSNPWLVELRQSDNKVKFVPVAETYHFHSFFCYLSVCIIFFSFLSPFFSHLFTKFQNPNYNQNSTEISTEFQPYRLSQNQSYLVLFFSNIPALIPLFWNKHNTGSLGKENKRFNHWPKVWHNYWRMCILSYAAVTTPCIIWRLSLKMWQE